MLPFELTKDTPYLALSGELWSVFYEYFNRNWSCYKGFLLYWCNIVVTFTLADFYILQNSEKPWHSGIILCKHPAIERWRYTVTPSLIGWVHTQNNPWASCGNLHTSIHNLSCFGYMELVWFPSLFQLNRTFFVQLYPFSFFNSQSSAHLSKCRKQRFMTSTL